MANVTETGLKVDANDVSKALAQRWLLVLVSVGLTKEYVLQLQNGISY